MTTITLSDATQALINTAINDGPGTNNSNYIAAYNAIAAEIQSNGGFNSGTVNWFSQAGSINAQATGNGATPAGTFIINYMLNAAQEEGTTITAGQVADASNAIASKVFTQLQDSGFVFTDDPTANINFAPASIVTYDAGAGLESISAANPGSNLDNAIWVYMMPPSRCDAICPT